MTPTARLLLTLAISACVFCQVSLAQTQPAPRPAAADARHKAALAEAVALLDSWDGNPSVLQAARAQLDGILRADPAFAPAHREYVRYHIMNGYKSGRRVDPAALAAAEKSLNEALRLNPKDAQAYVLAGHLYFLQGRADDAMNALNKAKSIGTDDPWLALNTADILLTQGRTAEAAAHYESVVASGTRNGKAMTAAYSGLIRHYGKTGQFQKVDETYRRLIDYNPQSAWSYGNYGGFLLCTLDEAEAAIFQFRKALERMNYGVARSGLAAALHREAASTPAPGRAALLAEAQSLREGTPVEVVTGFCRSGPAVAAVTRAAASAPAR